MKTIFLRALLYQKFIGYLIAFLGMIIGGEETIFTAYFLTHQGFFNFFIISGVLFLGVIIGDSFWLFLGRKINNKNSRIIKAVNSLAMPLDNLLLEHPRKTIFISKFTYNFYHLTLLRAGALNLKWKDLMKIDIPVSLLWIFIVAGLGYFSGEVSSLLKKQFHYLEIGLLVFFILFLTGSFFLSRQLKKKL